MVEKTIELTGVSTTSIEDAVNIAVARAAVTIENIRHLRVVEIDANVAEGTVAQWRVKIALSFAIQERLHE